MFKGQKETMPKELTENLRMMCHQIETINKELGLRKNQIEIPKLESTVPEVKNSLEGLHSRSR